MTRTMKDLGIDRLTPAERIALAQEIWESVPPDLLIPTLTPDQQRELGRRDAELDANPERALTRDEIKASVRSDC